MILQQEKVNNNVGALPTQKFSLDLSPEIIHKFINIFIKGYKDSRGSCVREYVSNNYDAMVSLEEASLLASTYNLKESDAIQLYDSYHVYQILNKRLNLDTVDIQNVSLEEREVIEKCLEVINKVDTVSNIKILLDSSVIKDIQEPTIVKLTDKSISFIDFGIGLSPERIKYIYGFLLSSTKSTSNSSIGAFGAGAKCGYSYTNNFFLTSYFNGVCYQYLLTVDDNNMPTIDFISESPTDRKNGTEITIQLNNGYNEYDLWVEAIRNQTCYLSNVIYEVDNLGEDTLCKGKYFTYSTLNKRTKLHINSGGIAYDLDFSVLGISEINTPVGINFDIGEIQPNLNRESFQYTDATKQLILDRIKLVADELITLHNTKNYEYELDISGLYELKRSFNTFKEIQNNITVLAGNRINLYGLTKHSQISMNKTYIKGLKHVRWGNKDWNVLTNGFSVNRKISNGVRSITPWAFYWSYSYYSNDYIYQDIKTNVKQNRGLVENHSGKQMFTIKELKLKDYKKLLGLQSINKKHWRETIIGYQTIQKDLLESFVKYSDVEAIEKTRTVSARRVLDQDEFSIYKMRQNYRDSNDIGTFENKVVEKDFFDSPFLCIEHKERKNLGKFTPLMKMLNIISVSKKEYPEIIKLPTAFTKDTIMVSEHVNKALTAYLINDLIKNNKVAFRNITFFEKLFPDSKLVESLIALNDYKVNNHILKDSYSSLLTFFTDLLEDFDSFDNTILEEYEYINNNLSWFNGLCHLDTDYYDNFKESQEELVKNIMTKINGYVA